MIISILVVGIIGLLIGILLSLASIKFEVKVDENEEKIKQAIEEIKENHTIITIAHRLNTIENADCIYVVDNGVIAESGMHDELIAGNGIYKRLYDTKDEVSYE